MPGPYQPVHLLNCKKNSSSELNQFAFITASFRFTWGWMLWPRNRKIEVNTGSHLQLFSWKMRRNLLVRRTKSLCSVACHLSLYKQTLRLADGPIFFKEIFAFDALTVLSISAVFKSTRPVEKPVCSSS